MRTQAIRAVLLAIAIAACLADMRPSSFVTQGRLSGRLYAWRTTVVLRSMQISKRCPRHRCGKQAFADRQVARLPRCSERAAFFAVSPRTGTGGFLFHVLTSQDRQNYSSSKRNLYACSGSVGLAV